MRDTGYTGYLLHLLLGVVLLLAAAALLNFVIDPYALYGTARIEGVSEHKPAAATRLRISKPYQVRRYRPRAVIGGNSRPEMGLDPAHACWPEEVRPVYNLGLPGAGLYRQARTLQHAMYDSDVTLVLWGLDFADFLTGRSPAGVPLQWPPDRRDFEDALSVDADGSGNRAYGVTRIVSYLHTLFSLDTLGDSLVTILKQADDYASDRLENGFNPARDYLAIIRSEGQQVLFRQKNREVDERFSRSGLSLGLDKSGRPESFRSVEHLLQSVDRDKVRVVLFINPYHVDYLRSIHNNGLWPQFEQWKRELLALSERYQVPLWDFSILTRYNSEAAPDRDRKGESLEWFWEPAHYKREVGGLMLRSLFGTGCGGSPESPVGRQLTPQDLEPLLTRERHRIQAYLADAGE